MWGEIDASERPIARLYRAALGDGAAESYLAVFARFDDEGQSGPAWNNAAAGFHLGWLLHHRLWAAAGWWTLLLVAVGLVLTAWFQLAFNGQWGVKLGLALALLVATLSVPGLWGTAWLHAKLRQRMIAAVELAPTIDAACESLQTQARERQRQSTWWLAIFSAGVLLIGLLGWVAPWRSTVPGDTTAVLPTASTKPLATESVPSEPKAVADAPSPAAVSTLPDDDDTPVAESTNLSPSSWLAPNASPVADASSVTHVAITALVDKVTETDIPLHLPTPGGEVQARVKGHGVAVGMFAVEANAGRTVAKLRAAGLPVLSDPVASARGTLTRVRVGPFERREQAEAAALTVKALGLDAKVYLP